jgi:predicted MPP superfamily phosphohydrolase
MWLAGNSGPFKLHTLSVQGVSPKPLRVLHISDLHYAPGQNKKSEFLSTLADLKPDLVVNTGDNLGHANAINPALSALSPLAKFPGVFVNGSNDYRTPEPRNPLRYFAGPSVVSLKRNLDTKRFTDELENFGWQNLNNHSARLIVAGMNLGFMGLDDPHEELDDLHSLASQSSEVSKCDLVLGVAHAPYLRVIEAFAKAGAAMTFAGHTHGGQICLPGQKALVSNCDLPTQYASGLSGWNFDGKQSLLHVSSGLGCSIYAPVRLFCPPSATLIELN